MFLRPLSELEFSHVETFCKEFSEGIRVEYKSGMISNIPKAISAFANTLGGILIIGVEVEKVSNRVKFPIKGMNKEKGIEDKIINSSLKGIYPSIVPEVRVLDVPDQKDKVIVVIKVHESIEAPHAIQNSSRIYIRTGSQSQPYELAEIDRIEYLLKRRSKPEALKQDMMRMSEERFSRFIKPKSSYRLKHRRCQVFTCDFR